MALDEWTGQLTHELELCVGKVFSSEALISKRLWVRGPSECLIRALSFPQCACVLACTLYFTLDPALGLPIRNKLFLILYFL